MSASVSPYPRAGVAVLLADDRITLLVASFLRFAEEILFESEPTKGMESYLKFVFDTSRPSEILYAS